MTQTLADVNNALTRFGYDILEPKDKRKSISSAVRREDAEVKGTRHRNIQSAAAELQRNLSLIGWMVRRHLDYVSTFRFRSLTGNKSLDDYLETLMDEENRPARADVAGKFTRERLFRLAETRRVLDGDTGLIKLADGRLQGVQADLIRDPTDIRTQDEQWINGIRINGQGRPLAFGVYGRNGYTGINFSRRVSARSMIHYGFFDRYASDQVRGISPITSALAPMQDVYENFDYALAKAKVSQLFAVSFFRESSQGLAELGSGYGSGRDDIDEDDIEEPTEYKVKFNDGPQVFDLDPGDKAEFLNADSPGSSFQDFTRLVIQVGLKSLDIPYSFFDEKHTNFFGSRAAWLHYDRSAKDKRDDQIEMRRNYTVWKYRQFIQDGRLPRSTRIDDLPFEWVPIGMPWWDPSKEIKGNVEAIAAGLDTPQRVCRGTGTDYYKNIDDIAAATAYAEDKGVVVTFAAPTVAVSDEPPSDESENDDDNDPDPDEDPDADADADADE